MKYKAEREISELKANAKKEAETMIQEMGTLKKEAQKEAEQFKVNARREIEKMAQESENRKAAMLKVD